MSLLEKYQPKRLSELIGNRRQAEEIKKWMAFGRGALLVWGPAGSGKSLAVRLAAKELNYEVIEGGDLTKDGLKQLFGAARFSMLAKKKIILIEDVELIESKAALLNELKSAVQAIIVTENPYETLPALAKICATIRFDKIGGDAVFFFLSKVCTAEGIHLNGEQIRELAVTCSGDMRAALIDLDVARSCSATSMCFGVGVRDRQQSMRTILEAIFRSSKANTLNLSDTDHQLLLLWLAENTTDEFKTTEEISDAYEKLSKADIFLARIVRRQSWSMLKYSGSMMAGITLSRKARKLLPPFYRPPRFARHNRSGTLGKISSTFHVARKHASEYVPIMNTLEDGEILAMGFDPDDIDFIRGMK